ncbi:hypothetical protein HX13_01200 [Chryseobacterium sp. P1-3]|uniref:hypothetical protein n=1 Tax=Chryseobacterium sp. (strain P1-3) TaxID=1517683 RepID=UPI0004E6CCA5|nr:hypothetical protein [Chryseobacterium sp. P1-3]KFF76000.1 hypothetical protein HX13_01200 [Chryseobacterium sp. P1-3]
MATITFRIMGIDDERRIMDLIMQTVDREGRYILKIQGNQNFEDLMANRLVQYKVLLRKVIKDKNDIESFEYSEGDNFASAKLKGAYKWIEEEKKRLNPEYYMRIWNKLSTNILLAAVVGAAVGALLTVSLTILFK